MQFLSYCISFGLIGRQIHCPFARKNIWHLHLAWHLQQVFENAAHVNKNMLRVLLITQLTVNMFEKFFFCPLVQTSELVFKHKVQGRS